MDQSERPNPFARASVCVLLAVVFALATCLAEQETLPKPELVTDRPDQTESSSVVPPGYFQVETGWTFTRNEEDGVVRSHTHELPGTLLRMGVVSRLELRLGWAGGMWEETRLEGRKTDAGGAGDMDVGAKIYLWEEQAWIPEAAFLAGTTLPIGQDPFSSGRADPSFRISLSHTLSERFSLGYNLGATWETELGQSGDRDTLSLFNYTAVIGVGLTNRVGVFMEAFGDVPFNASGGPRNSLDGGLTVLLRDNLQLDASVGVGISAAADDWFAGLGVSVRLPR